MKFKPSALACACALSLTLVGCGGSSTSNTGTDTFLLQGTTATGMPYPDGSEVVLTDAAGKTFTAQVQGGAGGFRFELDKSAKAPFVLMVSAADMPTLVSVSADAQPSRVNVTPITHLISALLSPSGDPTQLVSANVTAEKLQTQKQAVLDNILKPVTDLLLDTTDPLTGTIDIGKGHDLVLEALKIQVQPNASGNSTLNVSLKGSAPVDMPALTLGGATPPALNKLADTLAANNMTLEKSQLAQDGLPTQIAALLARMSACHAQPLAQRVTEGGKSAADIRSEVCKSLFLGNDPARFLHNSYPVSSTGAFKGIFSTSTATQGLKFSLPSFEYKVANGNTSDASRPMDGDIVFTARWVDGEDNSSVEEYWARPDSSGTLFLTGNLSPLDIDVSPRADLRDFPNRTGKNFYTTGYNLFINAKHGYAKVVATSPKGNKFTLVKRTGYDFYVLAKDASTLTTSSVVRLAGSYITASDSSLTPRSEFSSWFWAGTADAPDADLAALPMQGTWVFDLYANASDSAATVSVKRRTLQRAPTLGELKSTVWPAMTDAVRKDIQDQSASLGYINMGGGVLSVASGDKDDQPAWTVPAGAWSPLKLTVFGTNPQTTPALPFSDSVNVKPSARMATIPCAGGTADTHCADALGNYAKDMQLNSINFTGRDKRRVQMNYGIDFRK